MKIQIFKHKSPHPTIHEIRLVQSNSKTDTLTHFVPPLGSPELLFYIGNEHQIKNVPCKRGLIKGQYTIAQKIDFNPNYHFLSISLHPYGLKQLFNVNASDFTNAVVDMENHPMTTFLLTLFQAIKEIDILFIEQLTQKIGTFPLCPISSVTKDYIRATKEQKDISHSVKEVIKEKGIGLRTLQRKFKTEAGLTPKEYLSITRMNKIEQRLKDKPNVFALISDFDFTDQSHFIREVKQWRNYPPNELIKKKLLLSDQLPMPDFIHF
ncbi:MAG: helix-turn-helix transcriptional regulator [Chitinophagaceae bacterium]|nr:helix-turn-helix transcriptional regulator [Chitinophagaceae bacterium]MCW5929807.1 helix-turn-helix transcriptional regulator [Chitinophagaceae bacterium]